MKLTKLVLPLFAAPAAQPAGAFTFSGDRWFDPGIPVEYRLNNTEDEHCIPGEGELDEVRIAFQTWESVTGQTLRFVEGPYTATCGLIMDGQNTVSFEDCHDNCTGSCIAVTSTVVWPGEVGWMGHLEIGRRWDCDIVFFERVGFRYARRRAPSVLQRDTRQRHLRCPLACNARDRPSLGLGAFECPWRSSTTTRRRTRTGSW